MIGCSSSFSAGAGGGILKWGKRLNYYYASQLKLLR
jgi:hypothetical protein